MAGALSRGYPGAAAFEAPGFRDRIHGPAIVFIIVGALIFNTLLCLVNTVAFQVSDTMVMGSELILLMCAFALGATTNAAMYLVIGVFVAYMAFIMSLRPALDLKAIRDFLIPIAFYSLGRRYPDMRIADRAAVICGLIVVAFGLFEYFALDVFTKYFNIIQYYVARGTVAATDVRDATSTLFASGTRPDARTILPFLGQHRVSSVFLEPVSMGNFGAILYMWGLYRKEMRWRFVVLLCGATAITLADARFGLYVCIAATAIHFSPIRLSRLFWLFLPIGLVIGLVIYGYMSAQVDWENNLAGRLLWTARLITSLDARAVWGLSPDKPFLSDSGYAYSLNELGIVGVLGFWLLFLFVKEDNPEAWKFKALAATYFCLLLLISDSPYSIKTAALLWFMLGSSDGTRPDAAPDFTPRAMRSSRRAA